MSDFGLSSAGTTVAFASCMDERHPPENIVDGYMSLETLQSQSVRGVLVRPGQDRLALATLTMNMLVLCVCLKIMCVPENMFSRKVYGCMMRRLYDAAVLRRATLEMRWPNFPVLPQLSCVAMSMDAHGDIFLLPVILDRSDRSFWVTTGL